MRTKDRLTLLSIVVGLVLLTVAVAVSNLANPVVAQEYEEPLCSGEYHNHGYSETYYPMPVKILGFQEQEASNGYPGSTQWIRVHVNPGSGEVPFQTRVVWSTQGMTRCEACGVWTGEVPLDGNRVVELYDDTTPLELRCSIGPANPDGTNVLSVSMLPRYLPRPKAGLTTEPH